MSEKVDISTLNTRELAKADWPSIEQLFGARGACGGCWCMHWRVARGGKSWDEVKGEPNRKVFRKLIEAGKAHGILAFDGSRPVGWCSFGKRADFPRLERTKAYQREDVHAVWSINCFYLAAGYRGLGLAHQLAQGAIRAIRKRKGRLIEAYPVTLTKNGNRLPAAFAYSGPEAVFLRLGFREIQRLSFSRPLYCLKCD